MAKENERRFLVRSLTLELGWAGQHIEQVYIAREDGRAVRVRIYDHETGELTVKGPVTIESGARSGDEENIEISVRQARRLSKLSPFRIEKIRYRLEGWEIDFFLGELDGLIVAEYELPEGEAEISNPPEELVLGPEITELREYDNSSLSGLGAEEKKKLLQDATRRIQG